MYAAGEGGGMEIIMNVRNCRKCGRLFNYVTGPGICPACHEQMEAKFQEVRKYIQQHGRASMEQVSQECEVDTAQIQQWIRQERLQFSDDSPIRVACEMCGKMIGSGRFCNQCKDNMARKLNSAMGLTGVMVEKPEEKKNTSNRMRFLDK